MMEILLGIKEVLSSPPGITALAILWGWVMKKLILSKPAWVEYEGTIIAAIRHAERAIPGDSGRQSMQKLDAALGYVLRVYAERNPHRPHPNAKVVAQFEEGIQLVHSNQEAQEVA